MPELDHVTLEEAAEILVEKGYLHSIASVNWGDMYSYKPLTSFSLARGANELYVRFFVHGNCLRAVNSTDQSSVNDDSCVGLVLKNPHSKVMYDIAFNCIGTCAAYKKADQDNHLIEASQLHGIRRYTDLARRPFCEMEGLFNWQLIVAIPFSLLDLQPNALPEILNGNFYKRADATSLPHYLSWLPIKSKTPEFALPEYMGEMVVEGI
ncbi:MAG: carbohydrate-binding family 9-like protein [Bacteroidales bacterium]